MTFNLMLPELNVKKYQKWLKKAKIKQYTSTIHVHTDILFYNMIVKTLKIEVTITAV